MADARAPAVETRFGATQRQDSWLVEVLPVAVVRGLFAVYAALPAFEGAFYEWAPSLPPFSPPLTAPKHRWCPSPPAPLILGGPLSFRLPCYYYRKAYYRAFFLDPPACAVSER